MESRRRFLVAALALLTAFPGAAADVASGFLDVDGMHIHVLDTAPGRADLPVVLLVHGWAGCTTDFRPLLERVGDERRWVAFDFPGCGESDKPDIHYSITGMAEFVEAVRAALGTEAVDLVGHSLGGQIAVQCAVRHPDHVRRLALIDPDGIEGEEGFWLGVVRLDRLLPIRWADAWMRGLARGELWTIPECGHMPTAEKPAWTALVIEDFLRRP
jgi:pimeloyl-ACP methyl ester carboxylesterase